ncbi:FkbM family methyltransferase [Phyllobacterium sp. YR531]|uniref:FkbM family methyltransferase n=1 Tax=Phyllobacterium sp. YR531 TaxID=1144343 RepID=UPI00026F6389|nr:FkbM family methyltransferase [Phyllobacterium sp. YR531]EJN06220.1 methyltransferase, FkbM family [Phyllobacterium sp. YR531]
MKNRWLRRFEQWRYDTIARFFDTRYGRKLLVNIIGPRVTNMTINCGDHVMTVSPRDYIGKKVFRKGNFERDHVDRLLSILQERKLLIDGSTLLEIGGNIGTQTIYFALSQSFSQIVSIEADPRNFELLKLNITQNGLKDKVLLVNCAAGDTEGEIDFFQHQNNHGKSSTTRKSNSDRKITVPVRPVEEILYDTNVSLQQIGLIWMDIEGYEPVACKSMRTLLTSNVPVYMEFSPVYYGEDQSIAFIQYLAGFYEDCLIFRDGSIEAIKVSALPFNEPQFDILLFNSAI